MMGSELNAAVGSYSRYKAYKNYGVIFFGPGQAAVIEERGTTFDCHDKFTVGCLPTFGNFKGSDQDGTAWEICTSSFC